MYVNKNKCSIVSVSTLKQFYQESREVILHAVIITDLKGTDDFLLCRVKAVSW